MLRFLPHKLVSTGHTCRRLFSTKHLFDKVMVANRGEISERVMNTCKRLGIKTVAIYSTADAKAPFVQVADEAICVGPPTDSYLNTDNVLKAMKDTGAQAVHPGYGFLSENAGFCNDVQAAGATFLGPPVSAIQQLGDKLESKRIAVDAQVSIIPGHDGEVESLEQALEICHTKVPYPVLLKAAAGGGGKGMRVCYSDRDIKEAWTVAKAESMKFFKDDRILIEKFIEKPHHIEFQILAATKDGKTDVAVFPERECSIQRRNQKVIEETPSVLLNQETRIAMADQARKLCEKVGYESAGTVEFLVDEEQNFYFLEMNTRLQVEHPITESVTGVDLVEGMLHVGAGHGLPDYLKPHAEYGKIVPYRGHAIEARIYAEDPVRGFLPSTGPLVKYFEPTTHRVTGNALHSFDPPYVRLDSGVAHGHNVSPYYDPMLSKLIFCGENRLDAIDGMKIALDEYVIEGVHHNAKLVQSVLRQPAFREGATPTNFLPVHYPDGFHGVELNDAEKLEFAAAATVIGTARAEMLNQPPLTNGDTESDDSVIVRVGGQFGSAYRVVVDDHGASATVTALDEQGNDSGKPAVIKLDSELRYDPAKYLATLSLDGSPRTIQVFNGGTNCGEIRMQMYGFNADVLLQSPREYELSRSFMHVPLEVDTTDLVLSPMPGLLISYAVSPGDHVEDGQELCIVESMKMQNMIRSPRAGVIESCKAEVGSSLKVDEVIMTFETNEEEKKAA